MLGAKVVVDLWICGGKVGVVPQVDEGRANKERAVKTSVVSRRIGNCTSPAR